MLNYLKRLPISYLTMLKGLLPVASFLVELLHWQVLSQVLLCPSWYATLDGASNVYLSNVLSYWNSCNGFSSSILSGKSFLNIFGEATPSYHCCVTLYPSCFSFYPSYNTLYSSCSTLYFSCSMLYFSCSMLCSSCNFPFHFCWRVVGVLGFLKEVIYQWASLHMKQESLICFMES